MADPITAMSLLGAATEFGAATGGLVNLASVGFGIYSALSEHSAAKEATEFNARQAAEESAAVAVETERATKAKQRETRLAQGANYARAAAGEGGVSGSTFDLLADNAAQNALDLLAIKESGLASQKKIRTEEELSRKKTSPSMLGTGVKVLSSLGGLYGK